MTVDDDRNSEITGGEGRSMRKHAKLGVLWLVGVSMLAGAVAMTSS